MKKATSIAESSSDLILKVIKKHQKNSKWLIEASK